jgi:hypothetical protein
LGFRGHFWGDESKKVGGIRQLVPTWSNDEKSPLLKRERIIDVIRPSTIAREN